MADSCLVVPWVWGSWRSEGSDHWHELAAGEMGTFHKHKEVQCAHIYMMIHAILKLRVMVNSNILGF